MDTVHNAIAWYQKKIGSYDKQLWEESVEKKLLKVAPNVKNAPKKSVRLKTEYIDVDLIRGSTFTKTKPQVPWIYITRKAIARVIFFPFYYKWWVLQTSVKLYLLLLVLYFLQVISIIVYLRNLDHSIVEDELSFTEVTLPVILMFLLCLVHSQTVLAHIGHKPPKRTKPSARVIRPQKAKKTTRKGHRSSGNNSSACQDDSCTSSRSAKTGQVGKRQSDLSSSSSTKQQISQNETLSFPEMSQSNVKLGSSSESNVSASLSKSVKNENSDAENIVKRTEDDDDGGGGVDEEGGERTQMQDGCGCFGMEHDINRVSFSGFDVTTDQNRRMAGKKMSDNDDENKLMLESVRGTAMPKPLCRNIDKSSSKASSLFRSNSPSVSTSSLVVESLKCEACGKKKFDVSVVCGDNSDDCQSYSMQQRGLGGLGVGGHYDGCVNCQRCDQKKDNIDDNNDDVEFTDTLCLCNGNDTGVECKKEMKSGSEEEKSSPNNIGSLCVEEKSASATVVSDEDNDIDRCPCCSCQIQTPSSSSSSQPHSSRRNNKQDADADRSRYYGYYCDSVTEDSGIHSNLSSMDSVGSCHNAAMTTSTMPASHIISKQQSSDSTTTIQQGTQLSRLSPTTITPQPVCHHHSHSDVANVETPPPTATPTPQGPLLYPTNGEEDEVEVEEEDEEENTHSQTSSTTSSSLSTQKENIHRNKNNENTISPTITTTIMNTATTNSSYPGSSSNGRLHSLSCQSNLVQQQQLCSSQNDNNDDDDCQLRHNNYQQNQQNGHHCHHCHHHHHQHSNKPSSELSLNNSPHHPNPLASHSSMSADTTAKTASSTSSLSSTCGIQCFSELFAQEILNSETLREVSSTILMTTSDLDCSSSSVTGPLSSASFSSSSSAFSTNNMFSLPTKQTSSSTLIAASAALHVPENSHISPTYPGACTATSTMTTPHLATMATTANTHPNGGHAIIANDYNDDEHDNDTISSTTITTTTTIADSSTSTTKSTTSYLSLPKRRHFASRLPINHQHHHQKEIQQQQQQQQNESAGGNLCKKGSTNSMASLGDDDNANLDESMETDVDVMATAIPATSDADRISDISNYSPSESDSDAAGMEDLRNRCEEKRRKHLRFQELNVNTQVGGGTNSGSLSPHLSGASYKLDTSSPKPNTPNGTVSRSMVTALTRKPSPLKDLSLARKLTAAGTAAQTSSASDIGKSESTTRSCLRRRRRTSGNTGDADMSRTRSVPSSIGIGLGLHAAAQQEKNKVISSSENEGGEGYAAEGTNKATMSSEEWEDRIPLDESTSSNYSSSTENSDESEVVRREGEEAAMDEEEEEKTEYTTSTLHVINLLQPQSGSPSSSGNTSQPDKVSCLIWEMNECKKVDLTALDIGWAIIDKVDSLPESSDYFIIGVLFSILMGLVPLAFRGFVNKSWTNMEDFLSWSGLVNKTMHIPDWFMMYTWRQNLLMYNGILQRFFLSLLFFFLLSVADRTFKQRLLYAKHFSYLTSSRRARKFSMPHFRLNKVRNIKIWLSLRSYLKRRGPQRSVDVIVSASFMCGISVVCLISLQMLKDSGNYLDFLCNWELLVWCLALAVFLLRFMTLGLKINKKYRNLSVLITEQINLYLQMEQKPHKKEELVLANNVLRLAEDLLKELESPFKISGFSANPFIYNITKVIVLSAFSAVLTELLGFKLKLHKIKLKG